MQTVLKLVWQWPVKVIREHALRLAMTLIALALAVLALWPWVVTPVNSGESAVLFRRFSGIEMERVYGEGIYPHWPWNTFFIYDLRLQTARREVNVIANDGLAVTLQIAIRYRADYRTLPMLHRTVGQNFLERIVLPQTVAALRGEAGKYSPQELYNTREGLLDRATLTAIEASAQRFVLVDAVLIEAVTLPPVIQAAIEEKLKYEQRSLAYTFRLELERREAERKQIEATGIRDYNATVSETLNEPLIRWQGVQASKELATSNNAKMVLFGGSGQASLPLILGGGFETSATAPTAGARDRGRDAPAPRPPTVAGRGEGRQ